MIRKIPVSYDFDSLLGGGVEHCVPVVQVGKQTMLFERQKFFQFALLQEQLC